MSVSNEDEARTAIRSVAFYLHSGGAIDFRDGGASHPGRDRPLLLSFTLRDPAMYNYIWRQQLRSGMRAGDPNLIRLESLSDEEAANLRRTLDSVGALTSQGWPMRLATRAGRAYLAGGDELVRVTEVRLAMRAEDWIRVSRAAE